MKEEEALKTQNSIKLHLSSEDKILLQFKECAEFSRMKGFLWRISFPLLPIFFGISIPYSIGSILLIAFGVLMLFLVIMSFITPYKKIIYFTTSNVIKIHEKKYFKSKILSKMNYSDIAHIDNRYDGLRIFPKGRNGELHYNGEEQDYIEILEIIRMIILMEGHYCVNRKKEIIELLIKQIPMIKHPNLKQIYLAKYRESLSKK